MKLEDLDSVIFRDYIFKYLASQDVFNLGLCSRKLKWYVVNESYHPLSTSLQCLKTTLKHYYKVGCEYDNISRFRSIEKCTNTGCSCQNYRQRNDIVIMDPGLCLSCEKNLFRGCFVEKDLLWCTQLGDPMDTPRFTPCMYHCTLMTEMFKLENCNNCKQIGTFCNSCNDMLDK